VLAQPDGRGGAKISGDPEHPANFGRMCSKGSALGETLDLDGRLLHPVARQADGALARTSWDAALDRVAGGLQSIIDRDGPDAVAFYLSGQLLTEDYYVANKLMKGFIGSANVDTNSRLCMASSVAGHRRAFGADAVPGVYADLDEADLVVLVGSNAAWCHPVLFQRMLQNRQRRGAKLVVIDPRRTATAHEADLFLSIAPGMDTALFCGLLVHLAGTGALDRPYIAAHTLDFNAAFIRAQEVAPDIPATARVTELPPDDVARFFDMFRATENVVTCYSQGVNQSAQGTDKVGAIVNCHLATGRIGKPGAGPFSLTGQPNAMGGREVGGLANQLAAHMGFAPNEVDRVRRFWNAPRMAEREGLKAVQMFEAIARGDIKALWVMATNPAVSLPRAGAVREALSNLELFVISENVISNDTVNAGAHVLLPASAWGEKDGTVTNSERRISRQRAFLPPPGETKPDWEIVSEVARRMGFADAFSYRTAADIFREHAALSAFENGGTRDFDLSGLADISDEGFAALEPVQWPVTASEPHGGDRRFFADGGFFTPDRKARFIAPEPPALKEATSATRPLRLNTGRIRDQWHSMTRTGKSPQLGAHLPEPFVEVHPTDAAAAGLKNGAVAQIVTAHGACTMRVAISDDQRPGSLFVPIHWSAETSSSGPAGVMVAPCIDSLSGQPEAKATPASIAPVDLPLRGFVRTSRPIALPAGTWWTRVAVAGGCDYLIATRSGPLIWHDFAHSAFAPDSHLIEDLGAGGSYRAAAFVDGEIDGCLSIGMDTPAEQWSAMKRLLAERSPEEGRRFVSSMPGDHANLEPIVCACYGVDMTSIREAVAGGARSVMEIGSVLGVGTNCGSCLPELKRIIARERRATAV
jgi:assimilatory nitrate reductase catalytic subunit